LDDVEPSPEIAGRRSSVLRRLAEAEGALLITTVHALARRVPTADAMLTSALRLSIGGPFAEDEVRSFLIGSGYLLDARIEAPGTAIFLGSALEIFPAGALGPVRVGYNAGRVTEIHLYDLADQRDLDALDAVVIDVIDETDQRVSDEIEGSKERSLAATVFDYFPSSLLVVDHGVESRAERWLSRVGEEYASVVMSLDEWRRRFKLVDVVFLPDSSPEPAPRTFFRDAAPTRSFRRFIKQQLESRRLVILTAASRRDLRAMERRAGMASTLCPDWEAAIAQAKTGCPAAVFADLDSGFIWKDNVVVVAAADLLGSRATHQDIMMVGLRRSIGYRALSLGDVVIHMDRGMAILQDLVSLSAAGVPDVEMIRLQFADDDQVLLPLSDLRSIWRYSSDPDRVSLDKADGSSWAERRSQAENDIAAAAEHIADRVRKRQQRRVDPIVPKVADYETFAAAFDYIPTADQGSAITDVLNDLASDIPMDRLVCGDVGYGKTEVALRAAAAAVFAGKQIALAAPTTVLARQHFETFRRRFAPFGIEVGLLSRFTPAAEARSIKTKLADGSMSIVIGTHALAANGVKFNDLGLLVIDEEQHFGKAQKSKLEALAEGLNVLIMTATPIPRTLNEVQAGLRALSIIATPPVRRVPVVTVVEPFHEATAAAALRREHRRRGQSFVVCPRIEDIAPMAKRLEDVVPELRITALHGKMPAADIDAAMMSFAAGEADILLATNIIESGLDFPRANTIIVWRPDKFGLAQLHQLRGRVGRRSTRSFALFLTDPESKLSNAAAKRLGTLKTLCDQGAGFLVSAGDMDMRGGGHLLSERQSGHIQLLGTELSGHLLGRAMSGAGVPPLFKRRPEVNLDVPALLPTCYVKDAGIRLELYARIFRAGDDSQLEELEDEIDERFGDLPTEAQNLFGLARFELACIRLGISSVDAGPKSLAAAFDGEGGVDQFKSFDGDDMFGWKDGRLTYRRSAPPSERVAVLEAFIATVERVVADDSRGLLPPSGIDEARPGA
jgi:transcription-repair coupling factor (superfamily II helicase)